MSYSSDSPEEREKLPRWDFKRRTKRAKEINDLVFRRWYGEVVTSSVACVMADDLIVLLDCKDPRVKLALVSTIVQHERETCGPELGRLLSLQLAWNNDMVKRGLPLIRFYGVGESTWMPFEIMKTHEFEVFGRDMVALHLLCIGGSAAGYKVVKQVPWRFLRYFAYQVGFNRRNQYEDEPESLVGLRFAGLVEPSRAEDLDFSEFRTSSTMLNRNKKIIQANKEEE